MTSHRDCTRPFYRVIRRCKPGGMRIGAQPVQAEVSPCVGTSARDAGRFVARAGAPGAPRGPARPARPATGSPSVRRRPVGGLRRLAAFLSLRVEGVEVDGREHERRERALDEQGVEGLACVGEQGIGTRDPERLAAFLLVRRLDVEDARLLQLHHEQGVLARLRLQVQREDDLEPAVVEGGLGRRCKRKTPSRSGKGFQWWVRPLSGSLHGVRCAQLNVTRIPARRRSTSFIPSSEICR